MRLTEEEYMKPKGLILPEGAESSGIQIEYVKSRDVLYISGWYDDCIRGEIVGIEGTEISFSEFCDRLGIDLKRRRLI